MPKSDVAKDIYLKSIKQFKSIPEGSMHSAWFEQMPSYQAGEAEYVLPDRFYSDPVDGGGVRKLNCSIVFGRDRQNHLLSGYGKSPGFACAAIDIVAGRYSGAVKRKGRVTKYPEYLNRDNYVGPNFCTDASRIYISQKTKIDTYFGLPPGESGDTEGEAGIGIKSDHVRVIGRNTIKIFAGRGQFSNIPGGERDSNGEKLLDPRIELMAGNVDELHPMVLGENLRDLLKEMLDMISTISGLMLQQNSQMIDMHTAIAQHFHQGAGAGSVVTFPDPILAARSFSKIPRKLQVITDRVTNKVNAKILGINYLDQGLLDGRFIKRIKGSKSILSKNVYTT